MFLIGTIVDALAVAIGSCIGLYFQDSLNLKIKTTVRQVLGLCIIIVGFAGTLSKILYIKDGHIMVHHLMMIIISMALGGVLGEMLDIEAHALKFANLSRRYVDRYNRHCECVDGFISACMTTCLSAMLIVGGLQEGLTGNSTVLFTKATLDFVTMVLYSSAYGIGPLFAFIPIIILEGGMTLFAILIHPYMTPAMVNGINIVGFLILIGVGIHVMLDKKLQVVNMLPALLVVAVLATFWP